jgi:histidyl-tRNA synthetase
MKPETRLIRLLNQVKKKYKIHDKFKIRINHKESKDRRAPFMDISFGKIPTITVYINKVPARFEKINDSYLKRNLAHELIHHLVDKYRKEKDSKKLKHILKLIDRMIDC